MSYRMDEWLHPSIEIITVDELFGPPSMKTIALRSIRDIVDRSKCHLCCIISLCLPRELERELLQIIPGDFWVRLPPFFLKTNKFYINFYNKYFGLTKFKIFN